MKQRILELAARVDALSLRERGLVFSAACALLGFAGHALVLAPMHASQEALRTRIAEQQTAVAAIDGEITARVQGFQVDPDAPSRARMGAIRQEMGELGQQLLAIEHGLVPPERMGPLVDAILRANGRLKLVSMRTLPVEALSGPEAAGKQDAAAGAATVPAADAAPLLYRHGVEVTVRGNYLDMVDYMSALDAMPTRMFWGRAQLEVQAYPDARLTLTLHTLSLDRQWMKL
jgi:MSHA biogenesis protein MshJ